VHTFEDFPAGPAKLIAAAQQNQLDKVDADEYAATIQSLRRKANAYQPWITQIEHCSHLPLTSAEACGGS
jgi:hypothetical protein